MRKAASGTSKAARNHVGITQNSSGSGRVLTAAAQLASAVWSTLSKNAGYQREIAKAVM
jgi:hypothetical protein